MSQKRVFTGGSFPAAEDFCRPGDADFFGDDSEGLQRLVVEGCANGQCF